MVMGMEKIIKKIPFMGYPLWHFYSRFINNNSFYGSVPYWEKRYSEGGNSGSGSYGRLAEFKSLVLNKFVNANDIESVIEFGCGDGNQLFFANYKSYIGYDVSKKAIEICKDKFKEDKTKSFYLMGEREEESADLTLSLDVIYHLVEDQVFESYMSKLFDAANKYVIIYSSNKERTGISLHVRHREFSRWVEKNRKQWSLIQKIDNKYPLRGFFSRGSFADFYIYKKD